MGKRSGHDELTYREIALNATREAEKALYEGDVGEAVSRLKSALQSAERCVEIREEDG